MSVILEGARFCAFDCQAGAVPGMRCRTPLAADQVLSGEGKPVTLAGTIECKLCGWAGHIRDGQIETMTPGNPRRVDQALGDHFGDEP